MTQLINSENVEDNNQNRTAGTELQEQNGQRSAKSFR